MLQYILHLPGTQYLPLYVQEVSSHFFYSKLLYKMVLDIFDTLVCLAYVDQSNLQHRIVQDFLDTYTVCLVYVDQSNV